MHWDFITSNQDLIVMNMSPLTGTTSLNVGVTPKINRFLVEESLYFCSLVACTDKVMLYQNDMLQQISLPLSALPLSEPTMLAASQPVVDMCHFSITCLVVLISKVQVGNKLQPRWHYESSWKGHFFRYHHQSHLLLNGHLFQALAAKTSCFWLGLSLWWMLWLLKKPRENIMFHCKSN